MAFSSQNALYPSDAAGRSSFAEHEIRFYLINRALTALAMGSMLLIGVCGRAQSTQTGTAATHSQSKSQAHRRSSHSKKHGKAVPAPTPAAAPPPPPLPPLQQAAQQAKIQFIQGMLSIDAQNSSLKEILNQVSKQTGMQIQGLDHDERIYGQYGPDTVTNTLTDLLDGSGYNYVLIGGDDGAAPTKLLLAASTGGSSAGGSAAGTNVPPPANAAPSTPPPPDAQPADDPSQHPAPTPQEIFDQLRKDHPQ